MNENQEVFETMPVPKALATLAIPTIISQLITMIYNLADTFFIGQTNDPYKVASTSLAYVLFFMLNALANLFGIGGGSLLSRLLGQKHPEEAKKVCAFSFYGTILISFLYSLGCFLFMEPLLYLMGASENTIAYACSYTFWVIVIGGIPSTLSMSMSHLLRSEGSANQASFGLGLGGILNILLDPLFMFVLLPSGKEVTGAALATLLSNVISMLYFIWVFYRMRRETVLSLSLRKAKNALCYTSEILSVGFPSALSTLLASVSFMVTNNLSSNYGDVPVAAMGIVKKLDMLPLNVGTGLCQGMLPLVAYNYSANNHKRMKSVIKATRISGILFTAFCMVLFEVFANGLVQLFIKDAPTVALGTDFLRICCLATPFMFFNFQMCYTFQAMGKGPQSFLLSACRQGIFNIPLLFLMNHLFGLYGIAWTQLAADVLTLVLSLLLYRSVEKQLNS